MVLKAHEPHGVFLSIVEGRKGLGLFQVSNPRAVVKGFTGHTLSPHLLPHFLALGRIGWHLPPKSAGALALAGACIIQPMPHTSPLPSFTYTLFLTILSVASQQS